MRVQLPHALQSNTKKTKRKMGNTIKEEFTRVQRVIDGKYNLITANGKLLSDEWFEWIDYFHDGFAKVRRAYEKYNYIDKNGKLLSNEWFRLAYDFDNGFAKVQRAYEKYNYIGKDGKLLSNEWFKYVYDFKDGLAKVKRTNGEWCNIDKSGNLIKDEEMEVEVYNRNFPTWVDGLPLVTTIERNNQYLRITREDCFGKLHSMQRDGNKTTYYIHGIEVSKTMWQEYIRIWNKNW